MTIRSGALSKNSYSNARTNQQNRSTKQIRFESKIYMCSFLLVAAFFLRRQWVNSSPTPTHSRLIPICNAFFYSTWPSSFSSQRGGERRWPQNKSGVVHRYQATVPQPYPKGGSELQIIIWGPFSQFKIFQFQLKSNCLLLCLSSWL